MTDTTALEERLRSVLAADADRAPAAALTPAQFLQDIARTRDSSIRLGLRHRPLRWAAAAAAVLAAATAIAVTSSGKDSASAFASWTSRPSPIRAADIAGLDARCRQGDPLIVDRRGHSAYAVYANATSWDDCLTTIPGLRPDKGLPDTWLTKGSIRSAVNADAAHPIVVRSVKDPEGNSVHGSPVTWVSGRISAAVTRMTIQTPDETVEPTIGNGVFAAWWPGNNGDKTVLRAYDNSGKLLARIDQLDCPVPRTQLSGRPATGGCR